MKILEIIFKDSLVCHCDIYNEALLIICIDHTCSDKNISVACDHQGENYACCDSEYFLVFSQAEDNSEGCKSHNGDSHPYPEPVGVFFKSKLCAVGLFAPLLFRDKTDKRCEKEGYDYCPDKSGAEICLLVIQGNDSSH